MACCSGDESNGVFCAFNGCNIASSAFLHDERGVLALVLGSIDAFGKEDGEGGRGRERGLECEWMGTWDVDLRK